MIIDGVPVQCELDLAAFSTTRLVELFNKHATEPVTRFASRPVAYRRLFEVLQGLTQVEAPVLEEPVIEAPVITEEKAAPTPIVELKKRAGPAREMLTESLEKQGRKARFGFRLPPAVAPKQPRSGTNRALLHTLGSRPEGALFSEAMTACGWDQKTAYEGIRLLSVFNGFGLWSEQEGDFDVRFWVLDRAGYDKKRASAAAAVSQEKA
jgi:hypothetical protein